MLTAFVTAKRKIIGYPMLNPNENPSFWSFLRWISEISDSKSLQSSGISWLVYRYKDDRPVTASTLSRLNWACKIAILKVALLTPGVFLRVNLRV